MHLARTHTVKLKTLLKTLLILTALLLNGCLESTLTVTIHPDRTAQIHIQAKQTQSNSLTARLLTSTLGDTLSIAERKAWEDLSASMGKGVTLTQLDIKQTTPGVTHVDAHYNANDILTLKIGLAQAAPLLRSFKHGPAAWSYRFTAKNKTRPQIRIIPPRPRPQPNIISPRQALDQIGGRALGEQSIATLLSGAHIKLIIQGTDGLKASNIEKPPHSPSSQIILLDLNIDQLKRNHGFATLLDIKDYNGLQQLHKHHPQGLFMQDPKKNPLLTRQAPK